MCQTKSINTAQSWPLLVPGKKHSMVIVAKLFTVTLRSTKQMLGATVFPCFHLSPSLSPSQIHVSTFILHYPCNSLLPLPITASLRLTHLFHRLPLWQNHSLPLLIPPTTFFSPSTTKYSHLLSFPCSVCPPCISFFFPFPQAISKRWEPPPLTMLWIQRSV